MTDTDRARILTLLDTRRYSYRVIARMCGSTRGAVSGLAFRKRHKHSELTHSPNGRTNKTGNGWQQVVCHHVRCQQTIKSHLAKLAACLAELRCQRIKQWACVFV